MLAQEVKWAETGDDVPDEHLVFIAHLLRAHLIVAADGSLLGQPHADAPLQLDQVHLFRGICVPGCSLVLVDCRLHRLDIDLPCSIPLAIAPLACLLRLAALLSHIFKFVYFINRRCAKLSQSIDIYNLI